MDISIFLAKAFGIYFFVMGLALIFRRDFFQKVFTELLDNKLIIFLFSIITLILGILLIISCPIYTSGWRILITLLAWLTFIKGVFCLFFTEPLLNTSKKLVASNTYYLIASTVCLILSVYLAYHGFGLF